MKDRCQGVSYGETAERCKKRKAGQGWGAAFITARPPPEPARVTRSPHRLMPRGGLSIDDFGAGAADAVA
jgi:hypothetical protein